jgi:flagellar assembly factor FliW
MLPVQVVLGPGYKLTLSNDDLGSLGLAPGSNPKTGSEVICFAIITLMDGQAPTANLLAPIVINPFTHRGVQSIQADSSYSHVHPLTARSREDTCSS